jgi:DNA-binding response OmpR family regulator
MRILLIDDHHLTARGIALYLESHGHEVRIGACVADAVAACAADAFDLLITDLMLPDGTGWALLARVRLSCSGVRAIVMSGLGRPEDVAASLANGFDAHCVKPDDLRRLPEIVRDVMRRAAATRAGANPLPPGRAPSVRSA